MVSRRCHACPPSVAIGELTLGMQAEDGGPAILEHLLRCRRCVVRWSEFRAFLSHADLPQIAARPR